jgi:hypothetical protein
MVYPTEHTEPERAIHPVTVAALNWLQKIPPDAMQRAYEYLASKPASPIASAVCKTLSLMADEVSVDERDMLAAVLLVLCWPFIPFLVYFIERSKQAQPQPQPK